MKLTLFLIGCIFIISSCDMSVPTVQEYKEDKVVEPKPESVEITNPVKVKPSPPPAPIIRKSNKQDSDKIFEIKNLPITKGKPKHPTPPEDILDR